MDEVLQLSKAVARAAGDEILEFYEGEYDVADKGDDDPVTEADRAANDIIVDELEEYGDIPILTEEVEDDLDRLEHDTLWIVDPLDGTKEFIDENGEFTVNIALVKDGRPILGVIHAPAMEQTFYAVEGEGAFVDAAALTKEMRVSTRDALSEMVLTRSRSHATEEIQELEELFGDSIPSGSSIKGCRVANGDADAYIRYRPCHEWDVCAMDLLVEEAGGIMTDFDGERRTYNQEDTLLHGFVASNDQMHRELLDRV